MYGILRIGQYETVRYSVVHCSEGGSGNCHCTCAAGASTVYTQDCAVSYSAVVWYSPVQRSAAQCSAVLFMEEQGATVIAQVLHAQMQ